ncbi:MAG: TadE/TadG family type IV pilus assembly protein [Xanthobacteraceae bacterium]
MRSRFFADQSGGVAPLFALGLVPMVGLAGAAIDYSRASAARTAMQATLDSAALMVAKDAQIIPPNQASSVATNYFNAAFDRPEVQGLQVTASIGSGSNGTTVTATATATVATTFMQALGRSSMALTVRAGVINNNDGLGCVLALNPSASGAATAQGSTTVRLNGCSLYDNSKSDTALTVGGSATVQADFVGVAGGVASTSGITATNGIRTHISPVADPYADVPAPTYSGCNQNNFTAKNTVTINPGVYCGGIGTNANAVLTLSPGLYILDGGGLTVNGGATVNGNGVTLFFTSSGGSNWATVTINGNANVNLTPMSYGPTRGIVVFADRNTPAGTSFKFNGGATQYFAGAVYVPSAAVNFSGGANATTTCTQVIGDTVTFTGNSNLAIDCSQYNTRPFSSKTMRLSS